MYQSLRTSRRSALRGNVGGRRVRGVAMIEALVGFVIFAVGVVGLVGLQASMMRAQTSANVRADAVALAIELEGLMWSDRPANQALYTAAGCDGHPPCADWKAKLERRLPNAAIELVHVAGVNRTEQELRVTWTAPGGDTHRFETQFALPQP